MDNPKTDEINQLKQIDRFRFREQVTSADVSIDGNQIAVLTRKSVWLFEPKPNSESIFEAKIKWRRIRGVQQVESVAFSGDDLIIAEENGDLYKLPLSKLVEYN